MTKISDAELEVMKILWDRETVTSFDIINELNGKQEWTEATIRTLINRLQKKDAIKIVEKNGKTYTYKANISEEDYKIEESDSFIKKLYNGSLSEMVLNFVKQERLSKDDLDELRKLIESEVD